jgi:hypothetical protein
MPFQKGHKLSKGRPKGSKNKPINFQLKRGAAQRFRSVATRMAGDMGGSDTLSTAQKILIQRCAMLAVECERIERATIAGADFDAATYGQMTGHLARALRALGLKRVPRDVTPTLTDYLTAAREAAE